MSIYSSRNSILIFTIKFSLCTWCFPGLLCDTIRDPVVKTEKGVVRSCTLRAVEAAAASARDRYNREDPRLLSSISSHNKVRREGDGVKIERSREIYAWRTILMNDEISRRHRSSRQRLSERAAAQPDASSSNNLSRHRQ